MAAGGGCRQLVLLELRIAVAVVVHAEHEVAASGERHVKRAVAPVRDAGEAELVARHLGARVARHGREVQDGPFRGADHRVALVHQIAVELVRTTGDRDGASVGDRVLVGGRRGAVQREGRALGNGDGCLDIRGAGVVAKLRVRSVRRNTARFPRAVTAVEPEEPVQVDTVRNREGDRTLQPELARRRDGQPPDVQRTVHNAEPVVPRSVRRHGERRVGRSGHEVLGVVSHGETAGTADGRVSGQPQLVDLRPPDLARVRCDERAFPVRSVALDHEGLAARDLRACRPGTFNRVVVVEVELSAALHGDRTSVLARRAGHGIVRQLHRAAPDLDVGRLRQHRRVERERTRAVLHEPLRRDGARACEGVVGRALHPYLRRRHLFGHGHGCRLRGFGPVEDRRPERVERHGRTGVVLQPGDGRPVVARCLRTPVAAVQRIRVADRGDGRRAVPVHAREAEVPVGARRETGDRVGDRAQFRERAERLRTRHRRERRVGGPFQRQRGAVRVHAEVRERAAHGDRAAVGDHVVHAHARAGHVGVGCRRGGPDFDARHLVGGGRHGFGHVGSLVGGARERPIDARERAVREVADSDFPVVGAGRHPAVEREEHLRRVRRAGGEAVYLHGSVVARGADVVPVQAVGVRGRVRQTARRFVIGVGPELDPAVNTHGIRRRRFDAGHVRLHAQAAHHALVHGRERHGHVVDRASAEGVHRHPDPPREAVEVALRVVPALQLDVVAHAGEVRDRRLRVFDGVRHETARREVDARVGGDVQHAGAGESGAVFRRHVVLRAARGRQPRFGGVQLKAGVVGDCAEDGGAVDVRHLVLARPVGVEVRRGVEAADDVVPLRIVAIAGRVEVGEIRALRREQASLDGVPDHRVEGDHLRVLRRGVGDIDHRAGDELHVRLLVQRLPHEVRPGVVGRLGVASVVDVVRAEFHQHEIDVARLIQRRLDGIDGAAAAAGDDPLPADAGVVDPLVGHRRAADVMAVDGPEALRHRGVAGGGELLHQPRAPVAVGGVVALRDRVAHAQHVHPLFRRGVVEVEPEAAASGLQVLRPHLDVRAAGAGRVEDRGEVRVRHLQRAVVPRHQEEAPVRVRGVVGRERDLRAGGERGRRDEAEGELRRVVHEFAGGAHVEPGEVDAAHFREGRRAVRHEGRGREADGVVADVGECRIRVLRDEDRAARERGRRALARRPVAGRGERGVGRAGPHGVRQVGADGRVVVLHPEVDADVRVGGGADVPQVRSLGVVDERPVQRPVRIVADADLRVVRERPHADRAGAGGGLPPVVVGEEDLARGEGVRVGELAHQLEAGVVAGGVERVIEADRILPGFRDGIRGGRAAAVGVVERVEFDVPFDRVIVRGDGRNAAEVAPHVEFRDRLVLRLVGRDRERDVGPGRAGRVHVNPQRLQRAGVLPDQLDVVGDLRDAGLLHRRRVAVGDGVEVAGVAERGGRLHGADARVAGAVFDRDVVLRAERDGRARPGRGRVLAARRRQRHQLRLQQRRSRVALRRRDGGGHHGGEIDALDVRLRRAPRRDVGVQFRARARNRGGEDGCHRQGGLDARHDRLVVRQHPRVRHAVGDVDVAADEDREVRLVRRRRVGFKAFQQAGARGGGLQREVGDARMAAPGGGTGVHAARAGGAPAGHLHRPALLREEARERDAEGVAGRAAVHEVAAHRPDFDGRERGLGVRLGLQLDRRAGNQDVVVVGAARHVEADAAGRRDLACLEQRDRGAGGRCIYPREKCLERERGRRGEVHLAGEGEGLRPREGHRRLDGDGVARRVQDGAALLDVQRGDQHRRGTLRHVERAARVDRHRNGLGGDGLVGDAAGSARGAHHHGAAEDLHAAVDPLVGVVVRDRQRPRALLDEFGIRAVGGERRVDGNVARLVRDRHSVRNVDPPDGRVRHERAVAEEEALEVRYVVAGLERAAVPHRGRIRDNLLRVRKRGIVGIVRRDVEDRRRAVDDEVHLGEADLVGLVAEVDRAALHEDRAGRFAGRVAEPEALAGIHVDRERVAVQLELRRAVADVD